MKQVAITGMALLVVCIMLTGCDDSPSEPRGTATATANCGQNDFGLSIFCRDQSSDPRGVVVENGVRFEASKIGSAFQASRLTSRRGQVIFDVTGGGYGTYTIDQALLDDKGRVVASASYSIPVIDATSVAATAIQFGYVEANDERIFAESLTYDPLGIDALKQELISVDDLYSLAEHFEIGSVY